MSPPILFHDCLSNSAGFLQVRTVFLFSLGVGGVLLIFDSFGSSVVQPFDLHMSYVCCLERGEFDQYYCQGKATSNTLIDKLINESIFPETPA